MPSAKAPMSDISNGSSPVQSTGRRFRGAIVHHLGCSIVTGKYPVGGQLPGEIEASDALGVSRNAYREAIQYLVAKGMVETWPKTGTHVLPRTKWNLLDPEVISWIIAGNQADDFAQHLFELTDVILPAAAGIAALQREPQDLRDISAAVSVMRRNSLGSSARRAADQSFYEIVLRATGNPSLVAMTAGIQAAIFWSTSFRKNSTVMLYDIVPQYQKVHTCICDRDSNAARVAMDDLLKLSRNHIVL